jgi:hypothetical protein
MEEGRQKVQFSGGNRFDRKVETLLFGFSGGKTLHHFIGRAPESAGVPKEFSMSKWSHQT